MVDLVETALGERRWWVQSWPDGLALVAGQLAHDVQDVMIDTEGRWPACPVHREEALQLEPELGPASERVCEHGCGAVSPLAGLPD